MDILAKTGMGLGAHVDVTGTNGSGIAASNLLCPVGFLNGCSCFAVSRHFAFYLRSGNGVWDSALVFDNYTAQECREMSLQCPRLVSILLCLCSIKCGHRAASVCKAKSLKLGCACTSLNLSPEHLLVPYTCTHHNPSLFLASSIFVCAVAVQMMGRKQEKDLWLLSDQSLSISAHSDICHVQR